MIRAVEKHLSLEMLGLWVVESLLVLLVMFCLLHHEGRLLGISPVVDLFALKQAVIWSLAISLTSVSIGLYQTEICQRQRKLMTTAFIVSLLLAPLLVGLSHLLNWDLSLNPRSSLSLPRILAGWIACLGVTRAGFYIAQRLDLFARRILIVGPPQSALRVQNVIGMTGDASWRVADVVAAGSAALQRDELRRRKIWGVVVADAVSGPATGSAVRAGLRKSTRVFSEASFWECRLSRLDLDHLPPTWGALVERTARGRWTDGVHRFMDVLISTVLLFATLPLMALVAVLIKLESAGPVFYSQRRVGQHGKVFSLRKFRSMAVNAEVSGAPIWAAKNDPRVTRIGRMIRRTRIDELPQLLNVLSGSMSFIGPRPERPHFVDRLSTVIPSYADRACLKPGITGWAQVKYPYGASVEDARMKLAYDLYYVKNRSIFMNLLILVLTIRVILFQEGAR